MSSTKNMVFTSDLAKKLLPIRTIKSNKTSGGRTLIIAGSKGMLGAGVLAATAAGRVGAGYTYLCTNLGSFSSFKNPDFLTLDIEEKNLPDLTKFNSFALGPGLGTSQKSIALIHKWIRKLLEFKKSHVVLDADALTALSQFDMFRLPNSWVLTPHSGELSRLIHVPSKKIQNSPKQYVLEAQKKWGGVIVLKGSPTFICDGKSIIQVSTGTPALAKAGTGDVLTGMIAGLLAQRVSATDAACLGVYLHGLAGQVWQNEGNDHLGLLASDLLTLIPKAMDKLRMSQK